MTSNGEISFFATSKTTSAPFAAVSQQLKDMFFQKIRTEKIELPL
jgi:hypothetical protein